MAYKGKLDETEARERLQAFWECKSISGSPAVAVTSDNPEWEETKSPLLSLPRKERELIPDWQAHQTLQSIRGQCFIGEAMPGALVAWGAMLTTLPVFAGGDYDFESEDSSAWVRVEENYLERRFPVFDPHSPLAKTLDACHLAAREAIEGYGFVSPPLMTDPLTTLSQLLGAETTAFALAEEPERIDEWTSALTDMYIAIFDHYYALCDAGECIVFGGPMARGPAEAIQCDFSVMLSPKMYAKHVVPFLSRIAEKTSGTLYHLDGVAQMRFLDLLQTVPKLRGIQWNPEHDLTRPLRYLKELREIRERGFALYVQCESTDDAVTLTRELGPDGLFIKLANRAPTPEQARQELTRVRTALA